MATPYVRHQLHLHRPQVGTWGLLALLGLLLVARPALAQRKRSDAIDRTKKGHIKGITVENLANYNQRFYRPGLSIAPSFSRFFIEQSDAYVQAFQQGQGLAANSIISPGLGVYFTNDIRLGSPRTPFHLRFVPGLSFMTRRIEFAARGISTPDPVRTQEVSTTQLELPLLLKYQSNRRRNTRMYMVGGIKPSIAVTQRQNTPEINRITVNKNDLLLEYGFGFDLFYPYFKFGPELRFSHGLRNILQPGNNLYSNSLQSLRTNTVTLYLNIE
ncbi:MAG: PorT family protein [Hymenobacter sp.]|nr:MAG: PorT family protein [Hymenobacter sp.]